MTRTRRTWCVFGVGVAVVAVALGWMTRASLRLERGEREARAEAAFQETLRLALWRMDSALAPLIAQEAARPPGHYVPAQAHLPGVVETGSPLLGATSELIRLYFQINADGVMVSPQVLTHTVPDALKNSAASSDAVALARARLAELDQIVTRDALLAALAREPDSPAVAAAPSHDQTVQEFNARNMQADIARQNVVMSNAFLMNVAVAGAAPGPLVPFWHARPDDGGTELLLIRSVDINQSRTIQGIWFDWPRLEAWLLRGIEDLLPDARLVPVTGGTSPDPGRSLANVPARLDVDAVAAGLPPLSFRTPTRVMLGVAWLAVLLAGGAVAWVLHAAMDLGERRGQFVSAVTHELRTPLTTFRMYSEMLAGDMVPDEAARREYLATLSAEADRLAHVVENVLLYARVEQRRGVASRELITVSDLLGRVTERLANRAGQADMRLDVESDAGEDTTVCVDVQAVEQILFNLVDNACKYATSAQDRRLHLVARLTDGRVELLFYDHGPGIPYADRKRIFAPFRRASTETASATPGIGLGLALARGLARGLGGDLRLVRHPASGVRGGGGAAFRLTLPLVRS